MLTSVRVQAFSHQVNVEDDVLVELSVVPGVPAGQRHKSCEKLQTRTTILNMMD